MKIGFIVEGATDRAFLEGLRDRNVKKAELKRLGSVGSPDVILGVAVRNVECWLCADADHLASKLGCEASGLRLSDPKQAFEDAMGIASYDRKEPQISEIVRNMPPLKTWISNSPSFRRFYRDARSLASRKGCKIRNELEGP